MDLADRIKNYILKSDRMISYQEILARAAGKGYTKLQTLEALRKIHKMRSIRVTARLGTNYYDQAPVHILAPPQRLSPDKYPKMNETNDAHHDIFAGIDFSYLEMTPDDVKIAKWKRERDVAKELA